MTRGTNGGVRGASGGPGVASARADRAAEGAAPRKREGSGVDDEVRAGAVCCAP